MLGGVLWTTYHVALAFRPAGCIAAECDLPGRSFRDAGQLDLILLAAVLLLAGGLTGLVLLARRAGRFGRVGRVGLGASVAGAATIAGGIVFQAIVVCCDFPLQPWFVLPGGLTLVLGLLLVGIALLQARVLPPWVALMLIIGSLTMLGFNDQNDRVVLAVPFGLAWIVVGAVLWSGTAAAHIAQGRRNAGRER